ncbi:hypothetical protein [Nonomuraea basaltis]|uniref:hypothetical protein n=1 Tax=Nonomuraea basaltis TaxID=2495887 RepID=UPI00110C5E2A|nr:hypothetical protein [Nonomuraea basaltis]TMR90835.1 hypothetical protein EJK15_53255 [Nonomuraea basaltis]
MPLKGVPTRQGIPATISLAPLSLHPPHRSVAPVDAATLSGELSGSRLSSPAEGPPPPEPSRVLGLG